MFSLEDLDKSIRRVPDFPKPGILFYDITSILVNPDAFKFCLDKMVEIYKDAKLDAIAAIESRGFIFAAPLAEKLGIPLLLIRKKGKLPGETYSCAYSLEYGTAEIEAHKADIKKGANYLLVDDLIATGGTTEAMIKLIESLGGEVVGVLVLMELAGLKGREKIKNYRLDSAIVYEGK